MNGSSVQALHLGESVVPTRPMVAVAHPSHASAEPAEASPRRFEAMFDDHHDAIWRSLRRFGVADSHVDDATQRVFLVASRRLHEIRIGEERRFLYGVAMRVASEIRRRDPSRLHVGDEVLETMADPSRSPETLLIEHDARRALDDTLAGMPDDLRQVLVLVELEGVSVAQLASVLEIPVGTAASRLRRAREAFAESARRVRARLSGGGR